MDHTLYEMLNEIKDDLELIKEKLGVNEIDDEDDLELDDLEESSEPKPNTLDITEFTEEGVNTE